MSIPRRQFLRQVGAFSLALAGSQFFPLRGVSASSGSPALFRNPLRSVVNFSQPYLTALEKPHIAPLNQMYLEIIGDHTVSFILYDLSQNQLLAAIQSEAALPVASAFKGPLLMYFIDTVPPEIWNSLPIEYWSQTNRDAVPAEYREAWQTNFGVLFDLYNTIVFSSNITTGKIFGYLARLQNSSEPLALFNDWSHRVVGTSQLSALSQWNEGIPNGMEQSDPRYVGRDANIDHQPVPQENIMTARDMGLYYLWMLDHMDADQQAACKGLLSIVPGEARANIERLAAQNNGISYSKNGSLGKDLNPSGVVITDTGLIELPNGKTYLLSMLTVGAEYKVVPDMAVLTDQVLKGQYDDLIRQYQQAVVTFSDSAEIYTEHLLETYTAPAEILPDRYNYGFVKYEGIGVYSRPSEDYPVRNPVISSSRFGVHLLMQGALLRFLPVDDGWAEIIPDDPKDNIRTRLASRVFVKMSDLLPMSYDYAQPIDYFLDPTITPAEKFVIVNVGDRQLVGFERDQLIFKSPIALSPYATPRGSFVILTKWLCRSMQAWAPGVPFSSFFQADGYALHGAPWQRWEATVTQENLPKRLSAGCVNVPNWRVTLGDYTRPMDELLFRWLGGAYSASTQAHEYPKDDYAYLRIFVVDQWDELKSYALPNKVVQYDVKWSSLLDSIHAAPLLAPPSFFT